MRLCSALLLVVACAVIMAPAGDRQHGGDKQCHDSKMALLREASKLASDRSVGCSADSECVLVDTSLSCQEGCPLAILASARTEYLAALKNKDASLCGSANKNCRVGLICAPARGAVCVQRRCLVDLKGVKSPTVSPSAEKK